MSHSNDRQISLVIHVKGFKYQYLPIGSWYSEVLHVTVFTWKLLISQQFDVISLEELSFLETCSISEQNF